MLSLKGYDAAIVPNGACSLQVGISFQALFIYTHEPSAPPCYINQIIVLAAAPFALSSKLQVIHCCHEVESKSNGPTC